MLWLSAGVAFVSFCLAAYFTIAAPRLASRPRRHGQAVQFSPTGYRILAVLFLVLAAIAVARLVE